MTVTIGPIWQGPLYRRLSVALLVGIVGFGLTLLTIGARSPYTHSNLGRGFDPSYTRTPQALVGEQAEFAGLGTDSAPPGTDAIARGRFLFVTQGCASCHALEAQGGPVGPAIAGTDSDTVTQRVRQGPVGMPQFSAANLTEAEISAITAYLASLAPK